MNYVIISRHAAAVAFIQKKAESGDAPLGFLRCEVLTGNVQPSDVAGKVVGGNVPLSIASAAAEVWTVEFTGDPPRGAEYTAADMEAAGAQLSRYKVTAQATRHRCSTPGCCAEIIIDDYLCTECREK